MRGRVRGRVHGRVHGYPNLIPNTNPNPNQAEEVAAAAAKVAAPQKRKVLDASSEVLKRRVIKVTEWKEDAESGEWRQEVRSKPRVSSGKQVGRR